VAPEASSKTILIVAIVIAAIIIIGASIYIITGLKKPTTVTVPTVPKVSVTIPQTLTKTTTPTASPTQTKTATATKTQTAAAPSACKEKITLTILTRHPTEIIEAARKFFLKSKIAKEYCITDLKFIQLPPGWWPEIVRNKHIDVAWGGGPTLFDILFQQGLLRPLQTKLALEAAAQIPNTIAGMPLKRIKNGKIYWVAAAIASFGFTINRAVAKSLGFDWHKLKTWKDLASDALGLILVKTGRPALAIADPTQSTSNTRMYEIILQAYGWENGWRILTLMAANADVLSGSALVRDGVISGDYMVGITIDFYGYTAEKLNPACIYILPSGQTIVNGDPIAVTVSTQHPKAAEAFVAWVLTDGQQIWLLPTINRLPANPRVFETPMGKKRPDLKKAYEMALHAKSMKFNDTLAMLTEYAMQNYFKATLVDDHNLLQQAWVKLLKAYYIEHKISKEKFEELKKKLTDLPTFKDPVTGKMVKFTIKYAEWVDKLLEKKPSLLSQYLSVWREAARAKYLAVIKELGG